MIVEQKQPEAEEKKQEEQLTTPSFLKNLDKITFFNGSDSLYKIFYGFSRDMETVIRQFQQQPTFLHTLKSVCNLQKKNRVKDENPRYVPSVTT